jgi:YggT family protein
VGMLLKRLFSTRKDPVHRETVIREEPTSHEKKIIKEKRR